MNPERSGANNGNEGPDKSPLTQKEFEEMSKEEIVRAVLSGRDFDETALLDTRGSTETPPSANHPNSAQGAERGKEKNLSRRGFMALAAGATLLGVGGMAVKNAFQQGTPEDLSEELNEYGPSDNSETTDNHESEKFSTIREALVYIDNMAFNNDSGLIFKNVRALGCHYAAYENGEEHWVGYPDELKNNQELSQYLVDDNYEGLKSADEYGAHFEHLARNVAPVAAAELIALRHPDFANLTLREAEQRLLQSQEESPEDNESLLEWLMGQYKNTQYEFVPIPQNEPIMNMGILDPGTANHGRFIQYNTDELLRDEGNHLVQATTTLEDGTKVTRYVNPVCMNLLNKIEYEEPGNPPTEIIITTPEDDPIPEPEPTPEPKNQAEANENSGANDNIVQPESQNRGTTPEPTADSNRPYNPGTNTYDGQPSGQIGHEVTGGTPPSSTSGGSQSTAGAGGEAPRPVTGTTEGSGPSNDFNAGATVGTGEVTGSTPSASGDGTIEQSLDNATGVDGADYSEGF